MAKIEFKCPVCSIIFLRYKGHVCNDTPTCSFKCKVVFYAGTRIGAANNNYGKKWSIEKRLKQSELVKSKVTDEYRFKSGSANRGKKFSAERIGRMHDHRHSESYSHPHTEATKIIIGINSKAKFTPEYLQKQRKIHEECGRWIPLDKINDYHFYRKLSD